MDFEATRDFGERMSEANDRRQQPQSPVDVILGIREELAEFRRNGGKQALLALLRTMRGSGLSFEQALAEPGGIIEHLRDRGVIPPAPSRWPVKAPAASRPRYPRRRRRDGENG
jgi:hypothetical protein